MSLVWMDLETTGLDPDRNTILEVACVVTTNGLEPIKLKNWVLKYSKEAAKVLAIHEPIPYKMHTANGLLAECAESKLYVADVIDDLLEFLKDVEPKSMLAGSSVHFDRAFLRRHMTKVDKLLHHRHFDVTVLVSTLSMWLPEKMFNPPSKHRAMDDVLRSLSLAQHYKGLFFKEVIK